MNTRWIALALLSGSAVLFGQTSSSSWPQYLGPKRNGAVDLDITGAKLTEAWRRPLPSGTAGIAAEGGRLYTLGTDGSNDLLFALDAATGKELWRATIAATHVSAMENGPASTPAVAAGLIVAVGSSCGVAAFKVADGSIAWQHNLADQYKSRFAARGGCGMSPLIADKFVILTTGAAALRTTRRSTRCSPIRASARSVSSARRRWPSTSTGRPRRTASASKLWAAPRTTWW